MDADVPEFGQALVAATPRLTGLARKITHDPDAALDLVQDTLARAWRFRDSFEPGTNLNAWLNTVLRRQHLGNLRRQSLERRYFVDNPWADVALDGAQEAAVALADTKAALALLPAADASAVVMVGAGGLSYAAAADVLRCAIGTVKSRVSRGRRKLARAIGEEDGQVRRVDEAGLRRGLA